LRQHGIVTGSVNRRVEMKLIHLKHILEMKPLKRARKYAKQQRAWWLACNPFTEE